MPLRVLLLVCVLCPFSRCGPAGDPATDGSSTYSSPQESTSPLPESGEVGTPPPVDTRDDVADELTRLFESSFRSTPAPSTGTLVAQNLAELTGALRQVQIGFLSMEERLDTIQVSQIAMEQAQQALVGRMDAMQQSQLTLAGHLDEIKKTQQTVTSRIDAMEGTLEEVSDHVDQFYSQYASTATEHAQKTSEVLETLSAGFSTLTEWRGALSDRLDTLLTSQTAGAARLGSLAASQTALSAQLAELPRFLGGVSGRMDALLRLPITGCGGTYGGPLVAGGVPRKTLGTPCWADDECSSELLPNSVCGEERRCVCGAGFRRISRTLCRKIPQLGEPCSENADCLVLTRHSRCSDDGRCVCQSDFSSKNDTKCWPSLERGAPCGDRRQCQEGLDCVDGQCSCPVTKHDNFEYRIGGGEDCASGRAEMRREGDIRWDFACDDYWETDDATVFCRSLGFRSYATAVSGLTYDGRVFYAMDDVRCLGNEEHLANCVYDRRHDCSKSEIAGVTCRN